MDVLGWIYAGAKVIATILSFYWGVTKTYKVIRRRYLSKRKPTDK